MNLHGISNLLDFFIKGEEESWHDYFVSRLIFLIVIGSFIFIAYIAIKSETLFGSEVGAIVTIISSVVLVFSFLLAAIFIHRNNLKNKKAD